jgi:hypothetical protein
MGSINLTGVEFLLARAGEVDPQMDSPATEDPAALRAAAEVEVEKVILTYFPMLGGMVGVEL